MKTTFVFPGQGSQFVGMGRDLARNFGCARRIFEQADDVLGFSLSQLCFEGPEEQLKLTENTQPALLAVSIAALSVLTAESLEPSIVAGHSLGEYSAFVAAGALDFRDAIRLVRKRGQFMQRAVPVGVGAMAAILRLPEGKLDEVLAGSREGEIVSAANYNSPDQIVIAGHRGAVERAIERAKAAGARRAVMLPVSAPFHCELMRPAQEQMRAELDAVTFHDLLIPLINNWQAREIHTADEARESLYNQIPNPVRWTETVRAIAAKDVPVVIECGPGSVLCGLIKQIDAGLKCVSFGQPEDLNKVALGFEVKAV